MKDIMAIIRPNMVNKTKKALANVGIGSLTATGGVMGRGKGLVDPKVMSAATSGIPEAIDQLSRGPRLYPKRMLSVVVRDDQVKTAVETIIRVNQFGNPGDGKIFVLPVLEATRIRTGEEGEEVVQ